MKKIILSLLTITMSIMNVVSVQANNRRIEVVACNGRVDVELTKTGEKLIIKELLGVGAFPGGSYIVTHEMSETYSFNASLNVIEAFLKIGVSKSISTAKSVGFTAVNNGDSYSQGALWVAYDVYSVVELNPISSDTCQVHRSTVEAPIYYLYGFENSY